MKEAAVKVYVNSLTGAEIVTDCIISGENWELKAEKPEAPAGPEEKEVRKERTVRKNGGKK